MREWEEIRRELGLGLKEEERKGKKYKKKEERGKERSKGDKRRRGKKKKVGEGNERVEGNEERVKERSRRGVREGLKGEERKKKK